MNYKPLLVSSLFLAAALSSTAASASPFVSSGLAVSALETARAVRESADAHMTAAVTDDKRADGGSIWIDLKATNDKADSMLDGAGFDNDLAVVNLGADIRLGEAFFGVVYTYAKADTQSRSAPEKADGEADLFGVTAFGQRNFGGLNLALSAGWLYLSGDADTAALYETNANLWSFDAAARYGFNLGGLDLVPYAKVEYTLFRPRHHGDWSLDNANLWQFPLGVNAAYDFELPDGSRLRPSIDFAVIRTAGDTKLAARDGAGVRYEETFAGEHTLYRGMLGLTWTSGKGTLRAGYRYLGSEQGRKSHSYELKADYTF